MKALERPVWLALCDCPPVRSGKRWKFWDDAPPLAPLVRELCAVGIASLVPPLEAPFGEVPEDDGASLDPNASDETPSVWNGVDALVDAPPPTLEPWPVAALGALDEPAPLDNGCAMLPEALTFPDLLPPVPAPPAGAEAPLVPEPDVPPVGLEGGFPALAPAAAFDDDAIFDAAPLAPPAAAAPAPAIPAAAAPAAPPTAKPPTARAPAPSAGPPDTKAAARLGANKDSIARMIAAVRIVMAS